MRFSNVGRIYYLSFITGPPAVQQWRTNALINPADYETLNRLIEIYRNRLRDLDWFMKCLNQPIARLNRFPWSKTGSVNPTGKFNSLNCCRRA
jgi:hypothetical protein